MARSFAENWPAEKFSISFHGSPVVSSVSKLAAVLIIGPGEILLNKAAYGACLLTK
jgi:hypothetical protein